ncbi:flagellar basal body rod protein FlgC [Rhodobacteraceae bacterium XHP0102]|nr:flagellar basal body rod protein FlgC [Rhodobacteraceae bacterium XHP0102]
MVEFSGALSIAASGMRVQNQRLQYVSENIANSDTPGYQRKLTTFEPDRGPDRPNGAVRTGDVILDRTEATRIYAPGHPLADESGYYNGSNVNLVVELADAREAQRSYEANLRMFEQLRQMSSQLNELLRK